MDLSIGTVETEIVVTEGVGPLSAEEVQQLVQMVLEHLRQERWQMEQRDRDTEIHNRAYQRGR